MHEVQVNGTQADETLDGGRLDDDTLGDETQGHGDGSDGLEVEQLRRLRLSEFLRDLVRQEGKMTLRRSGWRRWRPTRRRLLRRVWKTSTKGMVR